MKDDILSEMNKTIIPNKGIEGTKLLPNEESNYQKWKSTLPQNLQYEGDYDLRGFYKENPKFNVTDPKQHLTDKYKLPNHPTFSNESKYYNEQTKSQGGYWKGEKYVSNKSDNKILNEINNTIFPTTLQTDKTGFSTPMGQFGKSQYDEGINPNNQDNTMEIRAQRQSTMDKIGNDIIKFGGTALSSASGLASLPYGIGKAVVSGRFADIYDNEITNMTESLNKTLEEEFPNYYTKKELEAPLYSPSYWFTTNFLFDKIGKNLGYTVGAIGEGMVVAKTLSKLAKVAEIGEMAKVGKIAKKYADGGMEIDFAYVKAINEVGTTAKRVNTEIKLMASGVAGSSEASIEGLQGYHTTKESLIKKFQKDNEGRLPDEKEALKIENLAEASANVQFGLNVALLTGSDFIQFGKAFSTLKDEEVKLGKILFNPKTGLYETAPVSKVTKVAKVFKQPAMEMTEEQLQLAFQKGSQSYAERKYDNPNINLVDNLLKSTAYGLEQAYGTKEGWENGMLGFITGGITGIAPGSQLREQLAEIKNLDTPTIEAIKKLNEYKQSEKFKVQFDATVRDASIQEEKDKNLAKGNIFGWKNNQFDQFKNYVQSRIDTGKFDVLKEELQGLLISNDEDFKNTFGIPKEGNQKQAQDYVNNLLNQAEKINKIYGNINTVYGSKFNKNVTDHLFDLASNIENRNERITDLNNKLITLTNGRVSFAPYSSGLNEEELKTRNKELKENVENWLKDETLNPAEVKANLKKLTDEKIIEDLNKLHQDRVSTVKEFAQVSTPEGLKDLNNKQKAFVKEKEEQEYKAFTDKVVNENLNLEELEKLNKIETNKKKKEFLNNRITKLKAEELTKSNIEKKNTETAAKVSDTEKELETKVGENAVKTLNSHKTKNEKLVFINTALAKINKGLVSGILSSEHIETLTNLKNYYNFQIEKLNKVEEKTSEIKLEDTERLQVGEQPLEPESIENEGQINLYLPSIVASNYTNLDEKGNKKLGTKDIQVKKESDSINYLLNELKIGDEVTISIDVENELYEKNKGNTNEVPVKIEINGNKVGYTNSIKYLQDEVSRIDSLANYFTGKSQLEVDEFFNKTFGNDDLLIQLLNIKEDDLIHIKKVLYFGKKKIDGNTKFLLEDLQKSFADWKLKISDDLVNGLVIRKQLGLDISKSLKTTISNKSSGTVIFNKDKEGKQIWSKVTDSFDKDIVLLKRPLNDNDGHSLISTTNGVIYNHRYSKNTYEKGEIYVGVKTAKIESNGKVVLIPIQLKSTTLEKDKGGKITEKVVDLIEKIGVELTNDKALNSPEIAKLRNQLSEIIVVNQESNINNRKLKINTDSIEFYNGEQHIEIFYKHRDEKNLEIKVPNKKPSLTIDGKLEAYSKLGSLLNQQKRATNYKLLENNKPYKSLVTGKTYDSYKEYLFEEEVLLTNVGKLTNEKGEKISNVYPRGETPMVIHINSKVESKEESKVEIQEQTLSEFTKDYSDKYKWLYKLVEEKGVKFTGLSDIKQGNAIYNSKFNWIAITKNFEGLTQEQKERILAHEAIHGLLKNKIDPKVKSKLIDFIKTLPKSEDKAINKIIKNIEEDVEELITYALTNKEFAQYLNSIKVEGEENKSQTLWGKLKELILEALGNVGVGKSKLSELNEILDSILNDVSPNISLDNELDNLFGDTNNDIKLENLEGNNIKFEEFESNPYKSTTTPGFTREEENHILNIVSNAYIRYKNLNGKDVTLGDIKKDLSKSAKNQVIEIIGTTYKEDVNKFDANQKSLLIKAIKDLKEPDSNIWKKVKSYLLKNNGIKITELEDINSIQEDKLSKEWDDKAEFSKNITDSINNKLKEFISTIPVINPLSLKISNDGNITYEKEVNTLTGIAESLNFNSVYPYIFTQMIGSLSKDEMMDRLLNIGINFDPTFLEIRKQLLADENLATMWYSSFNKQAPNRLVEFFNERAGKWEIKMDYGNKTSQAVNIISNEWIDKINKGIDSKVYDDNFVKKYADIFKNLNSQLDNYNKNKKDIIENTAKLFNLLGIDIDNKVIQFNIENKQHQEDIKKVTYENREEQLYYELFKNKLGNLAKYINDKKADTKTKFNEYGSLNELASLTQMFRYDKVVNTSRTVSGTNVYNIQNNNFLSSWFKLKDSKTEEGKVQFKKLLDDYSKDSALIYSNWLNKLISDEEFKNTFNFALYEGGKNTDINKGQEYTEINDTDWELKKYLWHIQPVNKTKSNPNGISIPLLALADKGTMYFIETQKIPLTDLEITGVKLNRESELWKAVYNTFLQEKERMIIAREKLFSDNILDMNGMVKNYHFKSFDKNDIPIFIDNNSIPTGNVFKFHNIPSINNIEGIFTDGLFLEETFTSEMEEQVKEEIDRFIQNEVKQELKYAKKIKKELDGKYTHIGSFETMVTEFTLNNYIANVEQGNLFFGTTALYKNTDDANKRAPQVTAMGVDYDLVGSFNAVVINGISLKTNTEKTGIEEIDAVLKKYNSEINDASSVVTFDEYNKRLKGLGRIKEFQSTIDKITNNLPVNELELKEYFSPLKEFYYSNTYDEAVGFNVATQVKNATIPLLPNFIKGTQLELLNNKMVEFNIQQINVTSAEKAGTKQIVTIADDKGNILVDKLNNLKEAIKPLYYKDLRVQLDVPDHIQDEHNKLGVQIGKNILNNIKEKNTYKIGNNSFTGKEIIEHYFDVLHENIVDSSNSLLKRLGAKFDSNGNPIEDEKGNIIINEESLQKILEDEVESRGLSDNFKLAIQQQEIGGQKIFNLPLYYSTMASKWESILTSLFTNNVTNQKFPGGHTAQVSGMFLQGKGKASEYTQEAQEITKDTYGIQWSKEILDRGDFILKSMQYQGDEKSTIVAEVLLPVWSKQFFDKDGQVIDIDTLPDSVKTMIGYRIPTETKHSMIVFKVVGFLPSTMGSVIVLPNDFVTQSGSDFDIDSIYLMQPNFFKNKEGKFKKVKFDTTKSIKENSKRARENRILDIYMSILLNSEHYKEIISSSSFMDLSASKKMVDKILGKDKTIINRYTNSGNRTYRNRGLEGRDLKGSSVSRDGFLSIASVAKIELREDLGIIQKYNLNDKRIENERKKTTFRDNINYILKRYGKNAKIIGDNFYILHNKIGWTENDDFKNVLGKEIADYSSQTTANILDIIKDPLPENINTYNFAVMKSFPDLGIPYDEMTLFASQPILKDLAHLHYESVSLLQEGKNDKKIIEQVKRDYQTQLYVLLKRIGKKPIKSYEESLVKGELINPQRKAIQRDLGYQPNLTNLDNLKSNGFDYPSARDYVELLKESIKPKPQTKEEIENRITYLKDQLMILEMFVVYKKTGQAFQDGLKAFNPDKLGAGPTIDVTDKLEDNINRATYYQDKPRPNDAEPRLLIEKIAATKEIYPKFFDKNSTQRSKFRMLESYYEMSNERAVKSLSTLFINRVPVVKNLISNIQSNISINSINEEFIEKKVNAFVNVYLLNDLPFFTDMNKQRILGINTKYDLKLDVTNPENFEKFKVLSTGNKLDLVKQQLIQQSKFGIEDKKYFTKSSDLSNILNYLESKTSDRDITNKGYEVINFLSNDKDDFMSDSFNEMWFNKNPYLRDLAQDLVKYTYITSGLTFGQTSMGKVIPTNILIDSFNDEENPKGIDVGKHLREKFIQYSNNGTIDNKNLENFFFRQNWKNNDIVPKVQTTWTEKENGTKEIDQNKIKWYPNKKGYIVVDNEMLSKERKSVRYAPVVKVNIKVDDKYETILFQQHLSYYDNDNTYYYPVAKLEDFEYTEKSFLPRNNIGINFDINYSELIDGIDGDIKFENIEKPFDLYTDEQIEELIRKCK